MEDVDNTQTPLGSKENPHPILPKQKDRIIGHYYIYKGQIRKQIYIKNRKYGRLSGNPETSKKYRDKNAEKIKKRQDEYRNRPEIKERDKKQKIEYLKRPGIKERNSKRQKEHMKKPEVRTKRKIYQKQYEKKNAEKISKYKKEHRKKPEVRKNNNMVRNRRRRKKRKENPEFRIEQNIRSRFKEMMKSARNNKKHSTFEYVGCDTNFLRDHLESQFKEGMNWDNYGYGDNKWNVDHRRPCASFDKTNQDELFMCWHWTNLQPMWQPENQKEKRDKFDPETFRYKWIDRETGWVGIPKYLMNNN